VPDHANHEGYLILQSVREACGFNRWLMRQVAPYLGNRVLEAGCGIGNLTDLLLDRERLICVDNDQFYVDHLARRFAKNANLTVHRADLTELPRCPALRDAMLDTVLCINVLEHIEDDLTVLQNFHEALLPGGRAIILVPAHPWLYTEVDRRLGHFCRYKARQLRTRLQQAGFDLVCVKGFNRLGTLGWFVSGKLLGRTTISPGQMKVYERLLPFAKLLEWMPIFPCLSLIGIGRKPPAQAQTSERSRPGKSAA
jgi:SAM-dependent methyltransferase